MPTYGYRCERCAAEFDVWQRMSDEPGADCPVCGGPGRRLFFPAGIVFKGAGFYKTDSRGATTVSSAGDGAKSSGGAAAKRRGGAGETKRAESSSSEASSSSGTAAATPGAD